MGFPGIRAPRAKTARPTPARQSQTTTGGSGGSLSKSSCIAASRALTRAAWIGSCLVLSSAAAAAARGRETDIRRGRIESHSETRSGSGAGAFNAPARAARAPARASFRLQSEAVPGAPALPRVRGRRTAARRRPICKVYSNSPTRPRSLHQKGSGRSWDEIAGNIGSFERYSHARTLGEPSPAV